MRTSTGLRLPAICLLALTLPGCSQILSSASEQRLVDTSVQSFKPLRADRADTCATQRQIAEHNSVYQSIKTGSVQAYCAPCDCPEKYQSKKPATATS
jgi:hypothetical protein